LDTAWLANYLAK